MPLSAHHWQPCIVGAVRPPFRAEGTVELISGQEGIWVVLLGAVVLRALPSLALLMQGCAFMDQFS